MLMWCFVVVSPRANSVAEHIFVFTTIAAMHHVLHVEFIAVRVAYQYGAAIVAECGILLLPCKGFLAIACDEEQYQTNHTCIFLC